MKKPLSRIIAAIAVATTTLAMPLLATAQAFPNKPIRIIVPFAAGGSSDLLARAVARTMSKASRARWWSRTNPVPAA